MFTSPTGAMPWAFQHGDGAMPEAVTLTVPTTGAAATPEAVATPPEPPADDDKALGENGEKALRAERKRAADAEKRATDLEARVKQFEDQGKTAEQKQAEQLASLSSERDTATVKALRYEVCEAKELPLAAARFLTGTTKVEIEEAADAFKALNVAPRPATGLPPAPNAGRETKRPNGAQAGLEEAQRRFGKPALTTN